MHGFVADATAPSPTPPTHCLCAAAPSPTDLQGSDEGESDADEVRGTRVLLWLVGAHTAVRPAGGPRWKRARALRGMRASGAVAQGVLDLTGMHSVLSECVACRVPLRVPWRALSAGGRSLWPEAEACCCRRRRGAGRERGGRRRGRVRAAPRRSQHSALGACRLGFSRRAQQRSVQQQQGAAPPWAAGRRGRSLLPSLSCC